MTVIDQNKWKSVCLPTQPSVMQTLGLLEELLVTWGDLHKCLLLVVEFPSNVIIICDFHPVAGGGFVWHHNQSNDQAETQEQAEKKESWHFVQNTNLVHFPLKLWPRVMFPRPLALGNHNLCSTGPAHKSPPQLSVPLRAHLGQSAAQASSRGAAHLDNKF